MSEGRRAYMLNDLAGTDNQTNTMVQASNSNSRSFGRVVEALVLCMILANVVMVLWASARRAYIPGYHGFVVFSLVFFTWEYALRVWSCVEDLRYRGSCGKAFGLLLFAPSNIRTYTTRRRPLSRVLPLVVR